MIEMQMPQNILKHKPKLVMGLNSRQLVFVAVAIGVALVGWFATKNTGLDTNSRIFIIGTFTLIPLAFGFIQIQEQPLEKMGLVILRENFLAKSVRYKEYRHPELEKWEKDLNKSEFSANSQDNGSKKKSSSKNSSKDIVVKRSKNYRGIR